MQKIIISDTSCLILLHKLGELDLLRLVYGKVLVTSEIAAEFKEKLPEWILVEQPKNKTYQKILEASLDQGEASAIALALEQTDCLLIIDELKGRNYAVSLGLTITGTIGVVIAAKNAGHLASIKPLIEKIRKTNFRLSEELEKKALELAQELD